MPVRTYMQVDPRHDHSFRIPRPDLSVTLGTPNACNDCHRDQPASWAAAAIERWYGPARKGFQSYADAFQGAWTDAAGAGARLAAVAADTGAPAFARAGALTALAAYRSPATLEVARKSLSDPDPMVRIGALDMLDGVPANQLWPLASPLLSDPSRGVRISAAMVLAGLPTANQPAADRPAFDRAAGEFIAAQRLNDDRPEARATLATFFARRGRPADAETEFKAALRLSPRFATAAVNLADLYRQLGRDAEGETVLRQALLKAPGDAGLYHALGLVLTRLKRSDAALAAFHQATMLEPDRARYAYVYAVALQSSGRRDDALAVLTRALARHPEDREILAAALDFTREAGDIAGALGYAERLARISPDPALGRLIEDLRAQTAKPKTP